MPLFILDDAILHANIQIGRDYPAPIVDRAHQREQALAIYREARG